MNILFIKKWLVTFGKAHISKLIFANYYKRDIFHEVSPKYLIFNSQQWLLDKQDLVRERQHDLSILTEEEYQKIFIFFANSKLIDICFQQNFTFQFIYVNTYMQN